MESGRLMPLFTYLDGSKSVNDGVIQGITVSFIKLINTVDQRYEIRPFLRFQVRVNFMVTRSQTETASLSSSI